MRNIGRRMQGFVEQAERLQAQALEMQQQMESGTWDPLAAIPAPSDFVKRVSCASCGAPKQLPTVREYLYCDFCGQLTDYDLRRASEAAATSPDITIYAAELNEIGPASQKALQRGDREAYRALQHRMYSAQAAHTPWAVPPRVWNDERYRQGWVDYSTAVAVTTAFDPTQAALTSRVRSLSLRLQWKGGMGLGILGGTVAGFRRLLSGGLDLSTMTPMVELASFWPLAEVLLDQSQYAQELITREGLRELDPDRAPPAVAERLTRSMLAQGWLRSMEPDDGQRFIEWLGLRHEYTRAEVHGEIRHCAGCGHDVTALPGATCVVCDGCGRRVDLSAPQIVCSGCNARIAFTEGVTHINCPYCQAEVRRT